MSVTIDAEGASHPGKFRERNDDQFLIAEVSESLQVRRSTLPIDDRTRLSMSTSAYLFVVADGLGRTTDGHLANDRATFAAVQYILALLPWFFGAAGKPEDGSKAELMRALDKCELLLPAAGRGPIGERTPGTTLTMAYLIWPELYVVHLGDSRCYVLRGSELHRVTGDHAELQRRHRESTFETENAKPSRRDNVLWRAFRGSDEPIEPEVSQLTIAAGDTILLCTDGLTRHVHDDEIATFLSANGSAARKCRDLIEAANSAGGWDNVTVVVSSVIEEPCAFPSGSTRSTESSAEEVS